MAKFKQVPQSFMFRKLVKYCRNMVKNFDSDCRDNDFFDVVRNCFDHDKAVELIEAAYTPAELEEMRHAKSRVCRLDLSDSLDDVLCALWNNEGSRDKCRAVLDAAREYMEADCEDRGEDVVGRRFAELAPVADLRELGREMEASLDDDATPWIRDGRTQSERRATENDRLRTRRRSHRRSEERRVE